MNLASVMSVKLGAFIVPLRRRYDACSPREKRLLVTAGLFLALAATFAVTDGIVSARAHLDRALPDAHARLAQMQAESAALAQAGAVSESGAASLEALQAMARARGIPADIKPDPGASGFVLSGTADSAKLLDWLAAMQQQWRLRAQRASFERVGGAVRFDIALTPPQG